MASGERIHYGLRAGDHGEESLVVKRVDGREGLSEPFRFDVDFLPRSGEAVDLPALLGAETVLSIRRSTGEERWVHGEAVRVELMGVAARSPRYRLTIAPRLARLGRALRSRVFQGKTVPEILGSVLSEHGVAHRDALSGSYPARDYVAQYRETDLAFVSRLMEGEGIWYRFEHSDGGHELVLGDDPGALARREGTLPVRAETGQGDGVEHVTRVVRTRRVTSTKAARRDFDFERPAMDLTAAEGEGGLEVYEYPGGDLAADQGKRHARTRLEELRYGEETYEAGGNAVATVAGTRIDVEGAGALTVVRVLHRGEQELAAGGAEAVQAVYANRFEAIPAERPYRPRRLAPVPRAAGIETATVVGPSGEEIHTDAHARVKVRFHWDREGPGDDRASCWVRVAQAWAGAAMGASFVPRVGQEVVIRFLEGDPDRPLVTGAIYNGANVAPVSLPSDKTKSTVRSASSPGGNGSNELRYEDAAGSEEVYLHAQKDANEEVGNDASGAVQGKASLQVDGDRTKQVLGAQSLQVGGSDASGIGGNATLTVAGARTTAVGAAHMENIAGANAVTVAGNRYVSVEAASAEFVGAASALNVGGGYVVNVGGALNHLVGGLKSTEVGGAALEVVGAAREETVLKRRDARTKGDLTIDVDGGATLGTDADATATVDGDVEIAVAGSLALRAEGGTLQADVLRVLVDGKVALEMKKSGPVTLSGANVTIEEG